MSDEVDGVEKKQAEKTISASVGRDGAYLEMDVSDMSPLIDQIRLADSVKAKMIVLKSGRLDLSAEIAKQFIAVVSSSIDKPDMEDMSAEQQGFYVFRKIFEEGVRSLYEKEASKTK